MNNQITTNDIFSKSFLSLQNNIEKFSAFDILLNISASFLIGLFIYYIYKKTFKGVLYQKSFAVSLIAIAMIVTLIIMTISGNLVLSLGMVGALSIVRFRTPIKDPVDLVFIFWAISIGIANGVSYYTISLIGSIVISIFLLFMNKNSDNNESYLLILHLNNSSDFNNIIKVVKESVEKYVIKSKTVTESYTEIILEIKLKKNNFNFIEEIQKEYNIAKATLIAYNLEYENI